MKNSIQIHIQKNNETNRWDISLPSDTKRTGFPDAYTTVIEGRQAKTLRDGIDGDGILNASCKFQNVKTNGLIGLEIY